MKVRIVLLAIFVFGAVSGLYPVSDRILVKVNNSVILESEVEEAVEMLSAQAKESGKVQASKLREQVISELVDQKLIITMAGAEQVSISDEAVADKVNDFLDNLRKKFGSEEEFEDALQKQGMSYTDFRLKIESQVRDSQIFGKLKQKKQQEFIQKSPVSETEMESYFKANRDEFKKDDEVNISQIFVNRGVFAGDGASYSEGLVARIKSGEDYSKVASSESGKSGVSPVDLDWVDTTQLDEKIRRALSKPKKGKVIGPVETSQGWHIIKINDYKAGKEAAYADVKDQVRIRIIETKIDKMWQEWVDEIKKKAYIKYM